VRPRLLPALIVVPGAALFVATIIVPVVALIVRSVSLGVSEGESVLAQSRYWVLLGRSLRLAVAGAAVSVLLSLPGAYVVGRVRARGAVGPLIGALLLAPLLLPPMVYAFGWQFAWSPGPRVLPDEMRCVWVWASWCWPVPALLIGAAWARRGHGVFEAAVLEGSASRAFVRVVLPLLVRPAALGGLIVLALLLGEYSVPHACNLVVVATSLLGWASQSSQPADVLVPSLPLVALILVVGALGVGVWRWRPEGEDEPIEASAATMRSGVLTAMLVAVVGLTVVAPIGVLASRLASPAVLGEALRTYSGELAVSVAVAVAAGLVAVFMGASIAVQARWRRPATIAALALGVVPGSLAAEGVLAAYRGVGLIYNHWPLLVVGYVARYGWIGLAIGWLAAVSVGRDVAAQARTDGAGPSRVAWRLGYVPNAALLSAGVAVVAAMSLADVAGAALLQVPGIGPISLVLLEKFHRFEDGMLISLSLFLVAGAMPAALLSWAALRRV